MSEEQFDWIDDAFDDKKTAEDMEKAKTPAFAGILLALALCAAAALVVFVLFALMATAP